MGGMAVVLAGVQGDMASGFQIDLTTPLKIITQETGMEETDSVRAMDGNQGALYDW